VNIELRVNDCKNAEGHLLKNDNVEKEKEDNPERNICLLDKCNIFYDLRNQNKIRTRHVTVIRKYYNYDENIITMKCLIIQKNLFLMLLMRIYLKNLKNVGIRD